MEWFKQRFNASTKSLKSAHQRLEAIPEGLALRCGHCSRIILRQDVEETFLCPHCDYHLPMPARQRIRSLVGETFEEWDRHETFHAPYEFEGYEERIQKLQAQTGLDEAIITGYGEFNGLSCAIGVMASEFLMGSMGTVVGEKLTRLFERAHDLHLPVILYTASGGARMQESILSLMQMAKVSGAVKRHSNAGLLFITCLTHPTTGGVTASFAMQADIIIAEPKATIGFAGRRVIEQTINRKLEDDFQTAERLFDLGLIDDIIHRSEQVNYLTRWLNIHALEKEHQDASL